MIRRKLKEVKEMVNGFGLVEKYEEVYIEGVSTDSRTLEKGQLFVPLMGENFDAHDFIEHAMEKVQ